ncbi:MAG: tRNA pseudouridine(38-40) synthase TruA, partial [Bdellovibrio sp.]
PVRHTRRRIEKISWRRKRGPLIEFQVTGNGFLKQMVRNIVGTQIDFWMKGKGAEEINRVLQAKDRRQAGPAAPPQGLFLLNVEYPAHLDKLCRPI